MHILENKEMCYCPLNFRKAIQCHHSVVFIVHTFTISVGNHICPHFYNTWFIVVFKWLDTRCM